jgi:hypothetical protein
MLRNPFTPTRIASQPGHFVGRRDELRTLERSLVQGSVAIQGPVGIGKSSLLARGLLSMEGFGTDRTARSIVAVGHRDIDSIDKTARLFLHSLVDFDEGQKRVKFKLGGFFEHESAEISRNFIEGRHLSVVQRLLEQDYMKSVLGNDRYLILAFDEADKCPIPLARVVRSVLTQTQQQGVDHIRFLVAGVRPFFQQMVDEDSGVARFFYETISLEPLPKEEAEELLHDKLVQAVEWAREDGIALFVDPLVVDRVVALSGGHPHLLQLLGSSLLDHEDDDPDGTIDTRDLANSLRRICYKDRARVYDSTLHELDVHGRLEALQALLQLARPGFPTSIRRRRAGSVVTPEAIHWLTEHNVIVIRDEDHYGLVDEFLRIRMIMDSEESEVARAKVEQRLLDRDGRESGRAETSFDDDDDDDDDDAG